MGMTITIERTSGISNHISTGTAEVLRVDETYVYLKGPGTLPILYRLCDGHPAGVIYRRHAKYMGVTRIIYSDLTRLKALPVGPVDPASP